MLELAPRPAPRPRPTRRFAASLGLAAIGPAPERVRIWRAGENPWDGGIVNFTPRAAAVVMAEFERRGNLLSMDIEHGVSLAEQAARAAGEIAPAATDGASAGYCALELAGSAEAPELWMVAAWSDCGREHALPEPQICCARHQIETRQRGQISPDWDADPQTGEPLRVNRISLVRDGATHRIPLLASRAAAERTRPMADPMGECRAAYAYHARMAAAGGDDAKDHETMAAKLKASAAALGLDLEKGEPAGEEPKAEGEKPKPETAAEPTPAPKGPEDQMPKPAGEKVPQTAARLTPAVPALTMAAVLQQLDERDALNRLLETNKDRIPEGHRSMLASQGLASARRYVEGLAPRPAPAGTGGDDGGASPGAKPVKPWRKPLSEAERYFAHRVRSALGVTEAMENEFEKRVDDDGGVTISMVELVERNRAARLAGRRAA